MSEMRPLKGVGIINKKSGEGLHLPLYSEIYRKFRMPFYSFNGILAQLSEGTPLQEIRGMQEAINSDFVSVVGGDGTQTSVMVWLNELAKIYGREDLPLLALHGRVGGQSNLAISLGTQASVFKYYDHEAKRMLHNILNRDHDTLSAEIWQIDAPELARKHSQFYNGGLGNELPFIWTAGIGAISESILNWVERSRHLPHGIRKTSSVPIAIKAVMDRFCDEFPRIEIDGKSKEVVEAFFLTNFLRWGNSYFGDNSADSYVALIGTNPKEAGRLKTGREVLRYLMSKILKDYIPSLPEPTSKMVEIIPYRDAKTVNFHVPVNMAVNVDSILRQPKTKSTDVTFSFKPDQSGRTVNIYKSPA